MGWVIFKISSKQECLSGRQYVIYTVTGYKSIPFVWIGKMHLNFHFFSCAALDFYYGEYDGEGAESLEKVWGGCQIASDLLFSNSWTLRFYVLVATCKSEFLGDSLKILMGLPSRLWRLILLSNHCCVDRSSDLCELRSFERWIWWCWLFFYEKLLLTLHQLEKKINFWKRESQKKRGWSERPCSFMHWFHP